MKYFSLKELYFSQTAIRLGINNRPDDVMIEKLLKVGFVLDTLRQHINKPIRITSGYRSHELNVLINGSRNSQHCKGEAVDFQVVGYSNKDLYDLFKQIASSQIIDFDQLIWQYNSWIHISISDKPRHQCLTINRVGTNIYAPTE